MSRERNLDMERGLEQTPPKGEYRADCPCVKSKCENYGYCVPCREKHKKSKPYCERGTAKVR